MEKKLTKLIGLAKSKFDEFSKSGELQCQEACLIPILKPGDEKALASVILSSIRLIKEFRKTILSYSKMMRGGQTYVFTEVVFPKFQNSRIDGLLLIVKGGIIKDAALFEMKNGADNLEQKQIERYIKVAQTFDIPRLITVSNQFVSEPTQFPIDVRHLKHVDLYHFSWTYLLTIAYLLLFENEDNIEDEDQAEIMREVVKYLENDKSGVCGLSQMKKGWTDIINRIISGRGIKNNDPDLHNTVISWQQEEKDLALILSRKLGVFVSSGETKYKGKFGKRIGDDKRRLICDKELISNLRVKGAVSNIKIKALFNKRTIEMSVTVKAPQDKKLKGRINWMGRQIDNCKKKNDEMFQKIQNEILIEIILKNTFKTERVNLGNLPNIYEEIQDREIKEFKVLFIKDFGKQFASRNKFVEIIEDMLVDFYSIVIQYLYNWEQPAPKIKEKSEIKEEEVSENKKVDIEETKKETTEDVLKEAGEPCTNITE